ncbi:MAG: fumarate hydratase [Chitinivibrionia bacterium]|nr:fumarate hydratase [Chitinivibrionia bacterium]
MKTHPEFSKWVLELIRRTSVDLSADIEGALQHAKTNENPGSPAASAFESVLENVALARKQSTPICQDTGTNIFFVYHPAGLSQRKMEHDIEAAVVEATSKSYLRPNSVDSLTGANSGNNLGRGLPSIHFHEWDKEEILVRLMLKGGGSENVGAQYSLPNTALGAGRDLKGVEIVVLDAINKAQGKGCAPGIAGVCIGGDRGSSYLESKVQLFRKLDDRNQLPELRELEERLYRKSNLLEIGPMGFGGRTTTLGVKIGVLHRLPASYFVSISYMCWACRRREMRIKNGGMTID